MASGSAEYGGRSSTGTRPVAAAIAFPARVSASRQRQSGTPTMSTWVNVWEAISCPSASTRRDTSGYWLTREPIWKKVACAWYFASRSRILGVHWGSGPSSNVNAIVFAGIARLLTVPSRSTRWTAAPSVTAVGAGAGRCRIVGPLPSAPAWFTYPFRQSSPRSTSVNRHSSTQCARGSGSFGDPARRPGGGIGGYFLCDGVGCAVLRRLWPGGVEADDDPMTGVV